MPCTIRPLRATDEADWRRLWTGYLEFYKTSVPEAVYVSTFARLLGDDEEVIYLQDLYVDPSVRGTGAGRALIEAVYAVADAAGTPAVYWLTQDFNTQARQLYDRIAQVTPFIRYNRKL